MADAAFTDQAIIFFQNIIGQLILIIGSIIAGLKYLDHKQQKDIEEHVKEFLQPVKSEMEREILCLRQCIEMQKQALEKQIELNKISAQYLERIVMRIQTDIDTYMMRRYGRAKEENGC